MGLFWPSMMKMRSQHVPEGARATIINFFRIPLNLFVCIVLYNVSVLPRSSFEHFHHSQILLAKHQGKHRVLQGLERGMIMM